jgi:hypothetical protein
MFGNPYDLHKFLYKKNHFKIIKNEFFVPNVFSLIVYTGYKSERLGRILRKKECAGK